MSTNIAQRNSFQQDRAAMSERQIIPTRQRSAHDPSALCASHCWCCRNHERGRHRPIPAFFCFRNRERALLRPEVGRDRRACADSDETHRGEKERLGLLGFLFVRRVRDLGHRRQPSSELKPNSSPCWMSNGRGAVASAYSGDPLVAGSCPSHVGI